MSIPTAIAMFTYGLLAGIALCDWANRRQNKRDHESAAQEGK